MMSRLRTALGWKDDVVLRRKKAKAFGETWGIFGDSAEVRKLKASEVRL